MLDERELEKLAKLMLEVSKNNFTGFLQVNYRYGGITNVLKQESILLKDPDDRRRDER